MPASASGSRAPGSADGEARASPIHVPCKGSGPALTGLMGGQVQHGLETMTAATPHVQSDQMVAIAQTRLKRAKGHQTVPTMQEPGFEGFAATPRQGLVAPKAPVTGDCRQDRPRPSPATSTPG